MIQPANDPWTGIGTILIVVVVMVAISFLAGACLQVVRFFRQQRGLSAGGPLKLAGLADDRALRLLASGRRGRAPRNTEPGLPPAAEFARIGADGLLPGAAAGWSTPVEPGSKWPVVLVIDDDANLLLPLQLRLAPYQIDVRQAQSGMQGYWMALDSRPDVILCDMRMPDGDGSYIVGRLRSHALTRAIPIIIVSGESRPGIRRAMLGMGASAYLNKPVVIKQLLDELRRHLKLPDDPIEIQGANCFQI